MHAYTRACNPRFWFHQLPHVNHHRLDVALYWAPYRILILCYLVTRSVHGQVCYGHWISNTLCHHWCNENSSQHCTNLCLYTMDMWHCISCEMGSGDMQPLEHHVCCSVLGRIYIWDDGYHYFMPQLLCLEYVITPAKYTYYRAHMHIIFQHCN